MRFIKLDRWILNESDISSIEYVNDGISIKFISRPDEDALDIDCSISLIQEIMARLTDD